LYTEYVLVAGHQAANPALRRIRREFEACYIRCIVGILAGYAKIINGSMLFARLQIPLEGYLAGLHVTWLKVVHFARRSGQRLIAGRDGGTAAH